MGRSTTRRSTIKYFEKCAACEQRIEKKGKCKSGFDNWCYRKSKNNKCPKCQQEEHHDKK